MGFEDRNRGLSSTDEAMSESERKRYQEDFLKQIISTAYRAGTPLKKQWIAWGSASETSSP